jgi:hypothetical protein
VDGVTPESTPAPRPAIIETARPGARPGPGRPRKPGGGPAPVPVTGTTPTPAPPPAEFTAETVAYFLRLVGACQALLVCLFFKVPMKDAVQIAAFSPKELEALTPPVRQVVNQRAPEWLRMYQAEIAVVCTLVPILMAKAAMLITYRDEREKAEKAERAEKHETAPAGKPNGSGEGAREAAA